MFYKFSVWENGQTFYADVTTEKAARQLICQLWEIAPTRAKKMWVKNNETGLFVGLVARYTRNGKVEYAYETTDSKVRVINTDGTFVKKTKKQPSPFGL